MGLSLWGRLTRRSAALALLALSACTFTPHELTLKPTVELPTSNVGENTRLVFHFVDDRDDVTIGHRGVATVGAKISANELPTTVEARLREMLQKKNYQLIDASGIGNADVTYRLRSFKFEIEQGFFTGGQNAAAALSVDARRDGKSYNTVYRYNSEERIMVVPGGNEIDAQMNEALTQILTKAATDQNLDQFVTGK